MKWIPPVLLFVVATVFFVVSMVQKARSESASNHANALDLYEKGARSLNIACCTALFACLLWVALAIVLKP